MVVLPNPKPKPASVREAAFGARVRRPNNDKVTSIIAIYGDAKTVMLQRVGECLLIKPGHIQAECSYMPLRMRC